MTKRETITGLALGIFLLIAFNVAISQALTVKPLPSQPALKVEQAKSIRYEDGSIDLQPASKTAGQQLQNTVHARDLQGN